MLAELVAELVAVDSVNPLLVPGGAGEEGVARLVAAWCDGAGLEVELEEAAPGRPNVIATAPGSGGGRTLMLNAHTDTVGVAGMESPFEARVEDGRLYGRGAYDMKGSLAACMLATARAGELGLAGDVVLAAVADEEAGSAGSELVAATRRADAAIVAEPTDMRLAVAHKGFVMWELETRGVAAHGSRPDLGVDAIARMGEVLVRLGRLAPEAEHPLLGRGSAHASLVEGGQEWSTYPERCLLRGERRLVPGEDPGLVERELAELLGELEGETRVVLARPPFEVAADEEVVRLVRRHAGDPELVGVPYWADSSLLAGAGIPTVLFGPGGEGAHAAVEWVSLADVERCAEVYLAVAAELCA